MKEIQLSQGLVAQVDDEDFESLNQHKWYAHKAKSGPYYAIRTVYFDGKSIVLRMHQVVSGQTRPDHSDGNGLNNRRSNLRPATRSQNNANKKSNGSNYKGVYKPKDWNKYRVQMSVKGKKIYLGGFEDEVEAAKAYDKAAVLYFGEFANLNFPE